MPHIIVTAANPDDRDLDGVMLRERVNPEDFDSERFAVNLIERLGWAVVDATEAERDAPETERDPGETERDPGRRELIHA